MNTLPDFRAAVVTAMDRLGLNAKQLSERSGVGYASVYDFARGRGGLTADNLAKVCGVLGITIKLPRQKATPKGSSNAT